MEYDDRSNCPECLSLERQCQHAIGQIQWVVASRFNTLGEKLNELYEWQDERDRAIKSLHEHTKSHARTVSLSASA